MSQYSVDALVLGLHNCGDADKVINLFSKEKGKIRAVAFGCRRARSQLAGGMQMFNYIEASLVEGSRIDTIRQCSIKSRFNNIDNDLENMAYASFLAELVWELSAENVPQPDVFTWLCQVLSVFGNNSPRLIALAAAYQLFDLVGLQPAYDNCVHCQKPITGDAFFSVREGGILCPDCCQETGQAIMFSPAERELICKLLHLDWKMNHTFKVKTNELLGAENIMLKYIHNIIGKKLKSLIFINQM